MRQRRLWTAEEDKVLKYLREQEKIKKWSIIAKAMQQDYNMPNRTGKQCRQRYFNHLDSQIKHQQWSHQEQKTLWEMHSAYGNRWTLMANRIKGRSENCIKNHFYSKVRKSVRKLNKYIVERYRTQYKQIKTSLLYKILESAEDKFRPGKSSDIQTMDLATNVKNRLFLYEDEITENPKQVQITKQLIFDTIRMQEKLKKLAKYQKNNSGFLDPRQLRKSNASFQNDDSNSLYSSTSFNSSFQPSQEDQQMSQEQHEQKPLQKTSSLRVKRSFQQQKQSYKVDSQLLGAQLMLQSLQLRPSKSQKSLSFQINIEDKVSDIQSPKKKLPGHFTGGNQYEKCISDIVKYEESEDDFDFRDQDFLDVKSNNAEQDFNFFGEPGYTEFQLRVFSPKVPSDEQNKMEEENI